jgi:apolipoprotein N-acyltransferase
MVRRDPTPDQIISAARKAPAPVRGGLTLSLLTAGLLWASFTPLDFGPLAWIALVPICLLARIERPTAWMYSTLYLGGLAFWIPTLQWMRLGDPTMYVAWIALSLYLALYFPVFIGLTRQAVHHWHVPLTVSAPVVWTGLELARAYLLTGFSWYYLAHSQHHWTEFIQISDLFGAYGPGFVIAATGACIAELCSPGWLARFRLLPLVNSADSNPAGTSMRVLTFRGALYRGGFVATLLIATLGYGYLRRLHAEFPAGPRVALIQGDTPARVGADRTEEVLSYTKYKKLTGVSMSEQPDIIIWPEGMFPFPLMSVHSGADKPRPGMPGLDIPRIKETDRKYRYELSTLSEMTNTPLIIGGTCVEIYPGEDRIYNSALFVEGQQGVTGRYDKLHRVIFGEYIPLVDLFPFLRHFTPYRGEFGIRAGAGSAVFEHNGVRYTPIICFEGTVPQLVRGIVRGTSSPERGDVDVLVNISNDGWFHGSSEHDQHLITASFRCVETRTPMVRAVNTGISAIIDGDGVIRRKVIDIHAPEEKLSSAASKWVEGVLVDHVPLDPRGSWYVFWGDWFAGLCLMSCILVGGHRLSGRWFQRSKPVSSGKSTAAEAGAS